MTRKEITGTRDLTFSQWVREKLPDSSSGFLVTDVDFFMFNYKTKRILIIEIKTHDANMKFWQRQFYKNLDSWMKKGIDDEWTYLGFYLIRFENTSFDDGKCYLNENEISEQELIDFLSEV